MTVEVKCATVSLQHMTTYEEGLVPGNEPQTQSCAYLYKSKNEWQIKRRNRIPCSPVFRRKSL